MPSFDIVSKVDLQEVDNAVNQTRKEIEQRYDFKGTHNEIALEKDAISILAADDYKLQGGRRTGSDQANRLNPQCNTWKSAANFCL